MMDYLKAHSRLRIALQISVKAYHGLIPPRRQDIVVAVGTGIRLFEICLRR
jgi:hypothetical protein